MMDSRGTYSVFLFIEHKGGDGPASVGASTGLTTDTDSGAAPAVLILGTRNGVGGHWHNKVVMGEGYNRSG